MDTGWPIKQTATGTQVLQLFLLIGDRGLCAEQ